MSRVLSLSMVLVAAAFAGCSSEAENAGSGAATSATATATAAATMTAAATAAGTTSAKPAEPPPRSDCPKDSAGPGTLTSPCMGKGGARMMEVTWTGKQDDKGPSFRVLNKSDKTILYGKVVVYFYDKAGKQMDPKGDADKGRHNHGCSGNLFAGVMKPGEKAVITFSCVGPSSIPDDVKFIEAEMQTVGFADASEKKSEFYWRNDDLVPDARTKGGVK